MMSKSKLLPLMMIATALLFFAGYDEQLEAEEKSNLKPDDFTDGALIQEPTIVECTLSDGTETTCYEIVTSGMPTNHDMGPFCPNTINQDGSHTGMWFDGSHKNTYALSGDFITNLATFYDDTNWQIYDIDTGEVFVTDTQAACHAAAVPDVPEEYYNYCVQCNMNDVYDKLNSSGGLSATFTIPVTPVPQKTSSSIYAGYEFIGTALNGVGLSIPAPIELILAAYNIAAFDTCGAHINPYEGYHYHGATDCIENMNQIAGKHASLIGYMLDGYALYAHTNDKGEIPNDLDECNGHSDALRNYHYHAGATYNNKFIGCFHGAYGAMAYTE